MKANSVAILDDFLLVCRRRRTDTDESVLARGRRQARKFDKLLTALHLPKAQEKDQQAAFSTI